MARVGVCSANGDYTKNSLVQGGLEKKDAVHEHVVGIQKEFGPEPLSLIATIVELWSVEDGRDTSGVVPSSPKRIADALRFGYGIEKLKYDHAMYMFDRSRFGVVSVFSSGPHIASAEGKCLVVVLFDYETKLHFVVAVVHFIKLAKGHARRANDGRCRNLIREVHGALAKSGVPEESIVSVVVGDFNAGPAALRRLGWGDWNFAVERGATAASGAIDNLLYRGAAVRSVEVRVRRDRRFTHAVLYAVLELREAEGLAQLPFLPVWDAEEQESVESDPQNLKFAVVSSQNELVHVPRELGFGLPALDMNHARHLRLLGEDFKTIRRGSRLAVAPHGDPQRGLMRATWVSSSPAKRKELQAGGGPRPFFFYRVDPATKAIVAASTDDACLARTAAPEP